MINWWRTVLGDSEAISASTAISNGNLSEGIVTANVETKITSLLNVKHCVMTPSGSTALMAALKAVGVKAGDSVVVPSVTWVASANAVSMIGAKAVLVDVCNDVPVIDVLKLSELNPKEISAIIIVHLNGCAANVEDIKQLDGWQGVPIIEDTCQAFMSQNKHGNFLGTLADVGCLSFGVTKLITCGQGGAVITNNSNTYEKLKLIKNNGVNSVAFPTYITLGINLKFSDILASVLSEQLDKAMVNAQFVNDIYNFYKSRIKNNSISLMPVPVDEGAIAIYAQAIVKNRNGFMSWMKKKNIDIRPYPPSLDKASHFVSNSTYNNGNMFGENAVYLPSGPGQNLEHIAHVCRMLNEWSKP